jgi:hypothetical protein
MEYEKSFCVLSLIILVLLAICANGMEKPGEETVSLYPYQFEDRLIVGASLTDTETFIFSNGKAAKATTSGNPEIVDLAIRPDISPCHLKRARILLPKPRGRGQLSIFPATFDYAVSGASSPNVAYSNTTELVRDTNGRPGLVCQVYPEHHRDLVDLAHSPFNSDISLRLSGYAAVGEVSSYYVVWTLDRKANVLNAKIVEINTKTGKIMNECDGINLEYRFGCDDQAITMGEQSPKVYTDSEFVFVGMESGMVYVFRITPKKYDPGHMAIELYGQIPRAYGRYAEDYDFSGTKGSKKSNEYIPAQILSNGRLSTITILYKNSCGKGYLRYLHGSNSEKVEWKDSFNPLFVHDNIQSIMMVESNQILVLTIEDGKNDPSGVSRFVLYKVLIPFDEKEGGVSIIKFDLVESCCYNFIAWCKEEGPYVDIVFRPIKENCKCKYATEVGPNLILRIKLSLQGLGDG